MKVLISLDFILLDFIYFILLQSSWALIAYYKWSGEE